MFLDCYQAERAMKERVQELLRQVEQRRLVRQALAGRVVPDRFHCRALAGLGRKLVAWGRRLERRYGSEPALPPMQASNGLR